jgi:hypothetical protein
MTLLKSFIAFLFLINAFPAFSQSQKDGIYIDNNGTIRWNKDKKEAFFFGVNYSAPFVFGYRHIKASGQTVEQAIKDDVYHLARLGVNAFRIHVFDTEITDSLGNIKDNDHLRLFDFLIAELKKRNIKILLTPIAYWGNGYPEKDIPTGSFSFKYGKKRALVEKEAWDAQENYLTQFFNRKNRFTGLTYQQDPDILATEVNNEPQHSGEKEQVTLYINTMVKAIRKTGWTKPVFYNISESPLYADAVVKADVQGHTFQWYPTGLVANRTQKGNLLPHVSQYTIPFDSIPAFKKRAKIVYEFDAADVADAYMYPAMARSFRNAGFQWATMFAYDPMAIANVNTEYQTHYLNLAYTPSKAISLLIAGNVFRDWAKRSMVSDSLFAGVKLSPQQNLSELNQPGAFYYSGSTSSAPIDVKKLQHIAGVGSSPVVKYDGTGAYFLDKIKDGVWRLEVMPDAVQIKDPFERASPKKEVTQILWRNHQMSVHLANLGDNFSVNAINLNNGFEGAAKQSSFQISPGTYLLTKKGVKYTAADKEDKSGALGLNEFSAPKAANVQVTVRHEHPEEISEHQPVKLKATVSGINENDKVTVYFSHLSNRWMQAEMEKVAAYEYAVAIPNELLTPGLLQYRIVISKNQTANYTFPGAFPMRPGDWDFYPKAAYEIHIVKEGSPLELFNANTDREKLNYYHPDWNNYRTSVSTFNAPKQLAVKSTMLKADGKSFMGWQHFAGEKMAARIRDLAAFNQLVLTAKATQGPVKAKIALITKDATSFATYVQLSSEEQEIKIDLKQLKPEAMLLLPRPYPGFLPLFYTSGTNKTFNLKEVEKVEVTFGYDLPESLQGKEVTIEVSAITVK